MGRIARPLDLELQRLRFLPTALGYIKVAIAQEL